MRLGAERRVRTKCSTRNRRGLETGFRAAPVPVSATECDVKTLEQETRASVWTTDMRQLPLFNFAALYAYFITLTKKFKHIELASTSYKKLKAYQYFAEGNVKGMQVAKKHGTTYVKAKVLPSMKRLSTARSSDSTTGKSPRQHVIVQQVTPQCVYHLLKLLYFPRRTCPGGLGKCNHIGGLLFAIEAFNKTELRDNPTPVSSTSRLSVWNVPRNDKVEAQEITNVKLGRIRYGKETKYMKTNHYDPRALHHRTVDQNALDMFRQKMGSMCPDSMFLLYGANRDTSSNSSHSHNGSLDPQHNTQGNGSLDPQHNTQDNGSLDPQHNTQASGSLDPQHNTQGNGSLDPQHNTQASGSLDPQHNTQDNGSLDPQHNTQASGSLDPQHNTQDNGSLDPQHNTQDNGSFDLPFNDLYDFSTSAFSDMMGTYMKSMKLSRDEQLTTEQETRGQGSSETWKEKRKEKLTSSNFGSAITCKVEPSNKVKGMLYSSFTTKATTYGNNNETVAVDEYLSLAHSENFHADCIEAGLILSLERPWLGASVDRLVQVAGKTVGGLEVKCPYSKQGCTIKEAIQDRAFFLTKVDGRVCLKPSHKYYHQVVLL
ncbi:PREDICTED: uncharacterized protein LOC109464203 [Branchiostoma belcheri]|uniref:Uncharacterized protein LOC109464203 n=1 Tax=Branchiostoma belcheri TaxID=7741 RepID=A0A6P4YI85_BRABE|nr:PREDICTED: uncharacterized protein LOC109464203 [Branchiostoma belcheri]